MIKKIGVDELRVGMFIHDFSREITGKRDSIKQLLVKNTRTIEVLKSWGIHEVYIDTAKGRKVTRAKTVDEVQNLIDKELHRMAKEKPVVVPTVSLKEEIRMAKTIKSAAVNVMQRSLQIAKDDIAIEVNDAYTVIQEMEQSVARNQDALILLTRIKDKDEYTLMHSISVGTLVLAFCKYCRVPYEMTMNLAIGALFHDLGKTKIPHSILNKPGKLSDAEFNLMKKHPGLSAKILRNSSGLPLEAYDIALHHHERYDGKGYPHGLQGDEIPFGSQIAAICDVYDAITSNRCYRDGIDSSEGLRQIYEWSGVHFSKDLAYKFIRCIGVYPIGTYVRLESNLIGVVVESTENILQPVVRVFYNDQKKVAVSEKELDLSELGVNIVSYESAEKWSDYNMFIIKDGLKQNAPSN